MLKYKFQNDALIYQKRTLINKQVKQYFSEIMELKEVKKYDVKELNFLILLGGKNVGKSYWAINEMVEVIKKGGRACYMRNSLNEIKAMKSKLAELIKIALLEDVKVSDEAITNWDKTKTYINFVQAKNYNKLSGNLEGYDIVVYDEFNQELAGNGANLITNDFVNIINTIFRNKKVRVIACGNTKTKNNVFFNLFKIVPKSMEANIELLKLENAKVLFIQYLQSAFKKLNGDEDAYELFKMMDEKNFNQMFKGEIFEREDEQVINNFDVIENQFSFINKIILKDERVYAVYSWKENKSVWFIKKTNETINLQKLEDLNKNGCEIYGYEVKDYQNENKNVLDYDETIAQTLLKKLQNFKLFFNSYEIYNDIRNLQKSTESFLKSIQKL